MLQTDTKIEEIRTICRLHGCPTGNWQDLASLPLRIAQDAGFRTYLTEVVRSLQARGVSLPEALDLLVLAVGGDSAPRQTRHLSEELNLLGGFLAGIGRWPGDNARAILAPGEIPDNIQQFTRPQPRHPAPELRPPEPEPTQAASSPAFTPAPPQAFAPPQGPPPPPAPVILSPAILSPGAARGRKDPLPRPRPIPKPTHTPPPPSP